MSSHIMQAAIAASSRRVIDEFEAKDALRTLQSAEKIKQDKPLMQATVLVAAAEKEALNKAASVAKIAANKGETNRKTSSRNSRTTRL